MYVLGIETSCDETSAAVLTDGLEVLSNVILSQDGNVIKGDKLVIDLKTGQSRIENQSADGKGARVKGMFMPKQSDKEGAESGATGQSPWQVQSKPSTQ